MEPTKNGARNPINTVLEFGEVAKKIVEKGEAANWLTGLVVTLGASAATYAQVHPYVGLSVFGVGFGITSARYARRKLKIAASAAKRQRDLQDAAVVKIFGELQDSYLELNVGVLKLVDTLKNGNRSFQNQLARAFACQEAFLERSCQTAVRVFAQRYAGVTFDANIKLIFVPHGSIDGAFCCAPMVRASTDHDRLEEDRAVRANPIPVLEHIIYRELLKKNYLKDYLAHPNVQENLKVLEANETVVYPNPQSIRRHANSMIVHLVNGPWGSILRNESARVLTCRNKDVIGIMCVDTPSAGIFCDGGSDTPLDGESAFQVALLKLLTTQVYSSFQLMSSVVKDLPEFTERQFK